MADCKVLLSILAAFLGMYLRIETASFAFLPGSMRATSRAFLGEILIYLEQDFISMTYF